MYERITSPWALIPAGGDGTRLRSLTTAIAGDARPNQFCGVLDGETLLDRTRRRVDQIVRPDRQAVVVTRSHARFYEPLVRDLPPGRLIAQPANRGTAPAIAYSMLRIFELDDDVPVIVTPSDYYVDDDTAFAACLAAAVDSVRARPGLITLLGVEPEWPETEYGWIEPGPSRCRWKATRCSASVASSRSRMPQPPKGSTTAAAVWNSFVMAGWAGTFLEVTAETRPALLGTFAPLRNRRGRRGEEDVAARVYRALPPSTSFPEAVLAAATHRVGVVRVKGVHWSDGGHPARVLSSLRRGGLRPTWLDRVELREAG